MKIQALDLFGKTVFAKFTIEQLVQMPTPMPEDEAGFVYVLKGKCVNYTETDQLNLAANQCILAKSGNSTFKTLPYNNETIYQAISIKLHRDILDKLYKEQEAQFFKKSDVPLTVNSVMLPPNIFIQEYIRSILPYFEHDKKLPEELLILKLKELIALLLQTEKAPKVLGIMRNLFEKKTFEFREIIKAHIFSSINVQELAQLTCLSLSSFKKEFKRIYDDTPQNYIIGKRIEKVAELLPNSNESLSNIAYDCEFKTLAHMSRVFKNKYGVSPSKFRQNFSDK